MVEVITAQFEDGKLKLQQVSRSPPWQSLAQPASLNLFFWCRFPRSSSPWRLRGAERSAVRRRRLFPSLPFGEASVASSEDVRAGTEKAESQGREAPRPGGESRARRGSGPLTLLSALRPRAEVREMLDAISRQLEEARARPRLALPPPPRRLLSKEATQGFPPFEREPKLKKEARGARPPAVTQLSIVGAFPLCFAQVFRLQEQHRILEARCAGFFFLRSGAAEPEVQLEKVLGHARASKEAVAKKAGPF